VLQVSRALAVGCVLAIGSTARADSADRFDAGTMAIQAGGGVVGGVSLGGAGGVIGMLAGASIGRKGDWGAPLAGAAIGGTIGILFGVPLGVHFAGSRRDANGTALGTAVGELGGFLMFGVLGTIAEKKRWKIPTSVAVVVGTLCVVGGPVVGYQLTNEGAATMPLVGFRF